MRYCRGSIFVFLLLCLCLHGVCVASDEASEKSVPDDDEQLSWVQDSESLACGWFDAWSEGDAAQEVFLAIKAAREDMLCTQVYRGFDVDCGGNKTTETVHFSTSHEARLSAHAAWAFVERYRLQHGYFCVALEDIADYGFFLDKERCVDRIKIGLPPKAHPCQELSQSAYGYHDALKDYKDKGMVKPIVFFSSGRRGFTGAGEFLFQLNEHGLINKRKNINVFFTALKEQEYLDARSDIAHEACLAAKREGHQSTEDDWLRIVDQCVKRVGCQQVYKGSVVFAQDEGNVLTSWDFDVTQHFKDSNGNYDVFVGYPLKELKDISLVFYLARAYRLYSILNKVLGAGCITGQENLEGMPDRSEHTLICLGEPFPSFITDYGQSLQKKFGYKYVQFLSGDFSAMSEPMRLVSVGGRVEEGDVRYQDSFDVLFESDRVLSSGSLWGYEGGIVFDGRVYARINNAQSRQYGFYYALERGGTAERILKDLELEKKDFSCEKVYCGLYVRDGSAPMGATDGPSKIGQIMHMSVLHEKLLSEQAVRLLLKTHQLREVFLCVGFEDFADFCDVEKLLPGGGVHVSTPKSAKGEHGVCKDAPAGGRFSACFDQYTPGQPIVFCASGRDGFASAGEFFCALCKRDDIKAHNPRVYFVFSVISEEKEFADIDGCSMIIRAAIKANGHDNHYGEECNACIESVAIADIYKGRVVFAQDKENLLMVRKPYFPSPNVYCGSYDSCKLSDVLVNFLPGRDKDPMSVAYWQAAYCLFEEMRERGAGCVTGDEVEDKARSERTLLCINCRLFDGAEDFGESVARKLGYPAASFIACDVGCLYNYTQLVAQGVVERRAMPEALTHWGIAR